LVASLALGVKMNILLFVPGLLVVMVQYRGIMRTIGNMGIIVLVQVSSIARYHQLTLELFVPETHPKPPSDHPRRAIPRHPYPR
jgi:hypothetical protein